MTFSASTASSPASQPPYALLSVSDKTALLPFAEALQAAGYRLLSTGGTLQHLQAAGLEAEAVSAYTGFPEMLGGRVKTLHPAIHGGILAKRTPEHDAELHAQGMVAIDVVVVNLYPFRETIARADSSLEDALENIDIGGPTMLRAAAKNFPHVLVVVDPADYTSLATKLQQGQAVSLDERRALAAKAFAHTAAYDAAINHYLEPNYAEQTQTVLELHKVGALRYGENPHQPAWLWRVGAERGAVLDAPVLQGKAMSFNNYQDAEAAWALLENLWQESLAAKDSQPVANCVAVKHANPCGVARATTALEAYNLAHAADPLSIFGGVVALDQPVDEALARRMGETFLEIILAPDYSPEALSYLASKKNLRLLQVPMQASIAQYDLRRLRGGLLMQRFDRLTLADTVLEPVSARQPDEAQWQDLLFAWTVCKHSKSNAIVLAKAQQTVGIGLGNVSRIGAAQQALHQADEAAQGAVLASDAFFPFDDVVRQAAAAGVAAVIAPKGAKRDAEVLTACNDLGIALVFTDKRHFKH